MSVAGGGESDSSTWKIDAPMESRTQMLLGGFPEGTRKQDIQDWIQRHLPNHLLEHVGEWYAPHKKG